jgi:hypothetical protein
MEEVIAERETPNHLVLLVHGINTRALWMGEIKPALERAGFYVAPTSYGKFGLPRFLAPFPWLRSLAIARVVTDIRTARRSYRIAYGADPKYMSVISHSFGTYVVSKIIAECPEFQWERIVLCGSVVRDDFRFDQVLERFRPPLLNEVGTRDYWPALAESAGWGYGSVGSTGFNRPPVETRWHTGFRHSDFLTERFCNEFWVPFLRGGKIRPADKPTELPLFIRAIAWLPLRYVILAMLATFVAYPTYRAFGYFFYPKQTATIATPTPVATPSAPATPPSTPATPPSTPRVPSLQLGYLMGKWILSKSGEQIIFTLALGGLDAWLPWAGQASLRISDGKYGSNVGLFSRTASCYYYVSLISATQMTWNFRGGDNSCFKSDVLMRVAD